MTRVSPENNTSDLNRSGRMKTTGRRLRGRSVVVVIAIATVTVLVALLNVGVGNYSVPLPRLLEVLQGGGSEMDRMVVLKWRIARTCVAVAVGFALGLSGALTQRLTRNGLASPDILGITQGAALGAVLAIVTGTNSSESAIEYMGVTCAALVGGLGAAAAIAAIAKRGRGGVFALVLVGIGINAFLHACVVYLLAATDLDTAANARVWMMGTLNGRTLNFAVPVIIVTVVCALVLAWVSFHFPQFDLGEDTARSLGVPVRTVNTTLLLISVVLASVAVSAVGPIGFVAFVAPQIALRLMRTQYPPLVASGAMGGLVVVLADLLARVLFPWEVPVGVVTAAIGGPVLLWLLWHQGSLPVRSQSQT